MQIVHKNEDERNSSERIDSIGAVIYTEMISKHLEEECFEGTRRGNTRIRISRGIFGSYQERV